MLCFDESTPIIMALSLIGAVMLIVGGSLWGSGDSTGKLDQMAAGIGLFVASVVLLGLAGIGCWCNQCFCTPERKSRLAERFYGRKKPDQPSGPPGDDVDAEAAECGSLGSSFRSFRSSRRSVRRPSTGGRRDRVQPTASASSQQQLELEQQKAAGLAAIAVITEQPEIVGDAKSRSHHDNNNTAAHARAAEEAPSIQQTSIDDVPDDDNLAAGSDEVDNRPSPQQPAVQNESIFVSC